MPTVEKSALALHTLRYLVAPRRDSCVPAPNAHISEFYDDWVGLGRRVSPPGAMMWKRNSRLGILSSEFVSVASTTLTISTTTPRKAQTMNDRLIHNAGRYVDPSSCGRKDLSPIS